MAAEREKGAGGGSAGDIEKYLEILAKDPHSRVFAPLAEAYRKAGLHDDAIEICREGLTHHPNYLSGRVALARALFEKKSFPEAKEEILKVTEASPDNLMAHKLQGLIMRELGDRTAAEQAFRLVTMMDPRDEEAQRSLEELSRPEPGPPPGTVTPPPVAAEPEPEPEPGAEEAAADYSPGEEISFEELDSGETAEEEAGAPAAPGAVSEAGTFDTAGGEAEDAAVTGGPAIEVEEPEPLDAGGEETERAAAETSFFDEAPGAAPPAGESVAMEETLEAPPSAIDDSTGVELLSGPEGEGDEEPPVEESAAAAGTGMDAGEGEAIMKMPTGDEDALFTMDEVAGEGGGEELAPAGGEPAAEQASGLTPGPEAPEEGVPPAVESSAMEFPGEDEGAGIVNLEEEIPTFDLSREIETETSGDGDDAARAPVTPAPPPVADTPREGGVFDTEALAAIYIDQGFYERAAQVYRRMLQEAPENMALRQKLEEVLALEKLQAARGAAAPPPPAPEAPAPATEAAAGPETEEEEAEEEEEENPAVVRLRRLLKSLKEKPS